jgi:hypothetical protein
LAEPRRVLTHIHDWLKDGGQLVCCVPNVRYWRIWSNLAFRGRWDYTLDGIMDQTHLRFFTARSFTALLRSTGFRPTRVGFRAANGPKQRLFNRVTFGRFAEFLSIQFMVTATKA